MRELPSGGRLGLDIETISPTVAYDEYPDFDDPTDFELLATAVAYEPANGTPNDTEEAILWRNGIDAASEVSHAQEVAQLIESANPSQIVTYNGERFDLELLLSRAEIAGAEVGEKSAYVRIFDAFEEREHLDLKHSAWETFGEYTSLEDVLGAHDLPIRQTMVTEYEHGHDLSYRPPTEPPYLDSGDIPEIGEAYLRTVAGEQDLVNIEATKKMIEDYALGDIEHLLKLADNHPF